MHAVLYVCLPRSEARSSLQARKKVCEYLNGEGFSRLTRFGGHCDYFSVGGRWSGRLSLLRLRHEQTKMFDRFWKRYMASLDAVTGNNVIPEMQPCKHRAKTRRSVRRAREGFTAFQPEPCGSTRFLLDLDYFVDEEG